MKVDIDKFQKVSLFEIFSKIELIPLETNEESLIKGITKVVVFDNMYFILDYGKAEILIFNEFGRFLYKISERGDGPNQYLSIGDFDIDQSSKVIKILSPVNNAMYEYDLSGSLLKKYKLPDIKSAYNRFKVLNKDTIAYWTFDYENRIKFYSKSKNIIIKETFKETDNIVNNFSIIFPYENFLSRSSSNVIYQITENAEIVESYKWDFGDNNNKISQIRKFEHISSNELRNYTSKILNSELINFVITLQGGTSQYYYSQLWRKNKRINIFYNKKNRNSYVFDKTIENAGFYPILWYDDYVIGFYSGEFGLINETIPDLILDDNDKIKKTRITEFDNPTLIKYYLKK